MSPTVLAASDVGPGGSGFLVVVILLVALLGLIFALRHSLKSLRRNIDNGSFDQTAEREAQGRRPTATSRKHPDAGA